jgi:hypothetical protein
LAPAISPKRRNAHSGKGPTDRKSAATRLWSWSRLMIEGDHLRAAARAQDVDCSNVPERVLKERDRAGASEPKRAQGCHECAAMNENTPYTDLNREQQEQQILWGYFAGLLDAWIKGMQAHGLTVTEYAKRLRISKSTMSRHLLDIGDRNRKGERGMGLVT